MALSWVNSGKTWAILILAAAGMLLLPAAGYAEAQLPQDNGASNLGASAALVWVEGGYFAMGDTVDDYSAEKPVHNVFVRSFYMSRHELTFSEYDAFCVATGRHKPYDMGLGRGNRPVVHVSWRDAIEYCNWRSRTEGLQPAYAGSGDNVACDFSANGYRLPTEAEWEYAAKGGAHSSGYKYSGSNNADDVAWYWDNSGNMTHPVGRKQANELGIYDMSGNVYEWCWDRMGSYQEMAADNPTGPASGVNRVKRGGSWNSFAEGVRSSYRYSVPFDVGEHNLGFRLVRTCP